MSVQEIVGSSGLGLVCLLTLIQIMPIQINPWSAIARCIGNALNKDIKTDIDNIKTDVNQIKEKQTKIDEKIDERDAISARVRILRFNDELLDNIDHSKDYFDQILLDIDFYDKYCNSHPDFVNSITKIASANIKKQYEICLQKHNFK